MMTPRQNTQKGMPTRTTTKTRLIRPAKTSAIACATTANAQGATSAVFHTRYKCANFKGLRGRKRQMP